MGRAIDGDALMKAMYHRAFETDGDTMWQSGCWVRYRAIEQTVKEQPTIEPRCEECEALNKTRLLIPQPERKGKWLVYEVANTEEEQPIAWECSECGAVVDCKTKFCPECGQEKEV